MKLKLSFLTLALLAVMTLFMPAKPAMAACVGGCCNCETVRNYIITEINRHENFLVNSFWKNYLNPALTNMGNSISYALNLQTVRMGAFLEGQDNIEKRRALQELSAQTARDYLPSEQLCRYASLGQSLSSSEEIARANRLLLMDRSQGRQLGTAATSSTGGENEDMISRAKERLTYFCDPNANGGQDAATCKNTNDRLVNADINYTRTMSRPSLDIDYTDTSATATDDERAVSALAKNLFASDLFQRPDAKALKGSGGMNDARIAYMDMRSIVAKRSVAENTFNTLLSTKMRGSGISGRNNGGSTSFIAGVLKEIGLSDPQTRDYLGKAPSYDAQMEVLTKKAFQSPSFYVNLMDNPANIERQYAALQSFGLMQQRDIFDSILRSEMLLSLIVELETAKYQDEVQGTMDKIGGGANPG